MYKFPEIKSTYVHTSYASENELFLNRKKVQDGKKVHAMNFKVHLF